MELIHVGILCEGGVKGVRLLHTHFDFRTLA